MKLSQLLLAILFMTVTALAQGTNGPVVFQPGTNLQKRIQNPTPSSGATNQTKKAVIGAGKTSLDTGDANNTFWTEPTDIADTGDVVSTDYLWDSSSKILYVFARATLRCSHGRSTQGGILIGIYGKKNFLSKAVGSGWWVVDLQQDECHAPMPGLYGCKFSPAGSALACGRAELDTRINDIAIVEATRF
jgi:hypothetical protein